MNSAKVIFELLSYIFNRYECKTDKCTPRNSLDSVRERIEMALTCIYNFFTGKTMYFSWRNILNYIIWTIILVLGYRNIDSGKTLLYSLCEITIGTVLATINWYLCDISISHPRRRRTHYITLLVMLVNYVVLFAVIYHASTISPFSGAFVFGVIAYSGIAFSYSYKERVEPSINFELIVLFLVGLLFHVIQTLTQTHISMVLPLTLFLFWLKCDYRHRNRKLYHENRLHGHHWLIKLLYTPSPNTAKIGNLFYQLDKAAKCAKVIPEDKMYKGICYVDNIAIPAQIVYKETAYKVTEIDNYAFYKRRKLSSVTIPEGVTTIGKCAFRNCPGLKNMTIPEGVTTIGECAFRDCSGLKNITIPEGVTTIGESAFWGCSGLECITIPESVATIKKHTFENCTKLKEITIPKSVTCIEAWSLCDCDNLNKIRILSETPPIGNYFAFDEISPEITLLVPSSAKESYQNTAPWKGFNIIGME